MAEPQPRKGSKADLQLQLNEQGERIEQLALLNSTLVSRLQLSRGLGKSFGGDRDLYDVLGYEKNPTFDNYFNAYDRDGLATRIVDAPCDETWRRHPILVAKKGDTPNENKPGPLQEKFNDFCNSHDIWAAFNEVDKVLGYSRFGLIFLGLPGNIEEEAKGGELAFVSVHDEGDAEVDETSIINDTENPRYGLPEYYRIGLEAQPTARKRVHYTRVLHVKEGKDRQYYPRIYGVPRLKNVLNRLYDLEKVVGGGSEAFWLLIHRGLALLAKEGMTLPDKGTPEYDALQDQVDAYTNGISRIMKLFGMDVKDLGAEPVDSMGQFKVLISYIAGSERIPQRLLIGSEAGKLASIQDDGNWADYIDWRRRNRAEPYILRKFIKLGMDYDFFGFDIPENYGVYWPSLFQVDDDTEAGTASKIATSMNQASGGAPETIMPPEEFAKRLPGKWRYEPTPQEIAKREADKAAADKANQQPPVDQNIPPDIQDILAKLPKGGGNGKQQIDKAKLNHALSGMQDVIGTFWFGMNQEIPWRNFVWHNFNGMNEYSTMVAFMIPDVLKEELRGKYSFITQDILDNMHITLCYLGDSRTLDTRQIDLAMIDFAEQMRPIKITMQGIARFVSGKDQDPIVATFDSPGNEIVEMRQKLTDTLEAFGIPYHDDKGFIPHMTLAYISKDADMPIDTIEPLEMNFDHASVIIGGEEYEYQLGESGMSPIGFVPGKSPESELGDWYQS